MTLATISIQVDDKAAQIYETVSESKRLRLRKLISFLVEEFAESTPEALLSLMDEMSDEAEAKGLTPEILEALLNEDE